MPSNYFCKQLNLRRKLAKSSTFKGGEYYFQSDAVKHIDQDKIETKFKRQDNQGEVVSAVKINCSTQSMLTSQIVVKDYASGKTHLLKSDKAATTFYKVPEGTVQEVAVNKVCHQ